MDQVIAWTVPSLMGSIMIMVRVWLLSVLSTLFLLLLIEGLIFSFSHDSVFDVDIGDGEPIRKLPYNRSGIFILLGIKFSFAIFLSASLSLVHNSFLPSPLTLWSTTCHNTRPIISQALMFYGVAYEFM